MVIEAYPWTAESLSLCRARGAGHGRFADGDNA
jgi:hypothetical protein